MSIIPTPTSMNQRNTATLAGPSDKMPDGRWSKGTAERAERMWGRIAAV
jgi:hypothetical protein